MNMQAGEVGFDWLVARLNGTPLVGVGTSALSVRTTEDFFVPPQFAVMEDSGGAPIVLLSARGAAGKTTVANELSGRLDTPVWRLQDDSGVSRSSVHSVLVQHLRVVDPLALLDELDSPLLIVDSLDEARSRVSATSWSEFIEALLEASLHGLRLLLMGRARTLEDLWVSLVDAGSAPDWFEVSHFDGTARAKYVDARTKARDPRTDTSATAYQQARDAILQALSVPMGGEQDQDRFVGYPPVLDAVAERLVDSPNFMAIFNEFASLRSTSRTAVLKRIIDELLKREQTKIAPTARDLQLDPASVYTPKEQAAWLLHDLELATEPDLLIDEPPARRVDYLERIKTFREDHPFRNDREWASPVFQAYIVAEEFDAVPPQAALKAGSSSGLLFELVCGDGAEDMLLNEIQFAAMHASLLAGQWQSADASVAISSEDRRLEGEFELVSEGGARRIPFMLLTDEAEEMCLAGPLTNLSVSIDCAIRVPAAGEDITLGPDLHLRGTSVHIEGSRAVFGRRDDDQGVADVEIQADSTIILPPMIAPPPPKKGVVEISPPSGIQLGFPWNEYQEEALPPEEGIDERAIRMLNKLMNLTRSHGHGGDRAVFIKKLEGRQGLETPQFRAALGCLEARGVVYVEGEMVFFSADWKSYRYSGKSVPGQRGLLDVMETWRPVLVEMTQAIQM